MEEKQKVPNQAGDEGSHVGQEGNQTLAERFRQKTYALGALRELDGNSALRIASNLEDAELILKLARGA